MAKKARPGQRKKEMIFIILGLLVAFSMATSYLCSMSPPPPPPTPTPTIFFTPTPSG